MMRCALSLLIAVMTCYPAWSAILITEVHPNGSSNASYAEDWFELTNFGATAINIGNWRVDDSSDSFGSAHELLEVTSIAPGQSVIFIEANEVDFQVTRDSFVNAWFGSNAPAGFAIGRYSGPGIGLSSNGDAVNIFDSSGGLITRVGFGSSVGFNTTTFDNSFGTSTNLTTFSSIGVNNAFLSSNGAEIGSPGIAAIPEPTSLAALGLLSGIYVVRRRLRNR